MAIFNFRTIHLQISLNFVTNGILHSAECKYATHRNLLCILLAAMWQSNFLQIFKSNFYFDWLQNNIHNLSISALKWHFEQSVTAENTFNPNTTPCIMQNGIQKTEFGMLHYVVVCSNTQWTPKEGLNMNNRN